MVDVLIEKIVTKLKMADITNIVSIDNDWKVEKNEIPLEDSLQKLISERKMSLSEEIIRELSNDGEIETIKELIESPNDKLKKLRDEVQDLISREAELQPALKSLDEVFTKIKEFYPEIKIEKNYDTNVNFSQYENNCLFILDKNMGKENADIIVDSIGIINKKGQEKNDIILIYSSENIDDYRTNQSKIAYLDKKEINDEHHNLLIYKMWAIGKKGRFEELLPEMHEMLLKSMYGNALHKIIQHKLDVEQKTYSALLKIDTEELSTSIKDSFIEGDNIVQSLDRVYESLKKRNEHLISNDLYMKSLESLIYYEREKTDEIVQDEVEGRYRKFRDEQLKGKLRSCLDNASHYNIINYMVNNYYSDISTGDLFRFKLYNQPDWCYGVLVTQSCNCVIRIPGTDVKEVKRDAEQMQLLLLRGEEIKENYSADELKKIRNYIWPIKINEKMLMLIPTEKTISIPAYVLDLCSLNSNGIANTKFDESFINKYKPYHSARYFSSFKELHLGKKFIEDGESIADQYEELLNKLYSDVISETACTIECEYHNRIEVETQKIKKAVSEKTISLKYNIEFLNDSFKIERIGRIEPQRTLIIIQDYIYKLSKTGAEPITAI